MRGSPPCAVTLRRFGAWRCAVAVVAAAALASLVAWVLLAPPGRLAGVRVAIALAGAATFALALSLLRVAAGTLRWDGSAWTFADSARPQAAPIAGELEVAIDLGSFLLLRFTPHDAPGRRAVRWLPAARRGLEREWHAFRCALYSPRPAAGPSGAAGATPS
jgi:hypothetical protein